MLLLAEPIKYSDASGTAPYTNASKAAPAAVYIASSETTHAAILARVAADLVTATTPAVVVDLGGDAADRCHRLFLALAAASGSTDGQTNSEDIYGVVYADFDGTLAIHLHKLGTHDATHGTLSLGGRQSGAQKNEKSSVWTDATGVPLDALSGGGITIKAMVEGASKLAGIGIVDTGPYRAILRCGAKGTSAGWAPLHQRWR